MNAAHGRRLAVIGLGYVGLPVAVAFARGGSSVIGYDRDRHRIAQLKAGFDRTGEVDEKTLAAVPLLLSDAADDLAAADFHIVAAPTPIAADRSPDLRPLIDAAEAVGRALREGAIVVFESTVYPGATEDICIPALERASGLRCGAGFTVGYTPERINPGDPRRRFETIPKVIAAQDGVTLDIIARVYGSVIQAPLHHAPNIRTAEAAKVIENTQRDLNIALMNELAMIFARLGLDTQDVLAAAATKWNFIPFSPGLVGGHCVGVDPYYLTYQAECAGHHPEVILAGRHINDGFAAWVARETLKRLQPGLGGCPPAITVLGMTFKEDVPDCRNTRVADLVRELEAFGAIVRVHDPKADPEEVARVYGVALQDLEDVRAAADTIVLAVPHQVYREGGWDLIAPLLAADEGLVVDVRACLDRAGCPPGIRLWRP